MARLERRPARLRRVRGGEELRRRRRRSSGPTTSSRRSAPVAPSRSSRSSECSSSGQSLARVVRRVHRLRDVGEVVQRQAELVAAGGAIGLGERGARVGQMREPLIVRGRRFLALVVEAGVGIVEVRGPGRARQDQLRRRRADGHVEEAAVVRGLEVGVGEALVPRRAAVGGAEQRDGGDGLRLAARGERSSARLTIHRCVERVSSSTLSASQSVWRTPAGAGLADDARKFGEHVVALPETSPAQPAPASDSPRPRRSAKMSRVGHEAVGDVCVTDGATRA